MCTRLMRHPVNKSLAGTYQGEASAVGRLPRISHQRLPFDQSFFFSNRSPPPPKNLFLKFWFGEEGR